jgi:Xaa-Pro aminopeptidase
VPDQSADLLYACGYSCSDPIAWFRVGARSFLLVSDLELEGARRLATVNTVLPLSRFSLRLRAKGIERPGLFRALGEALHQRGVRRVEVPAAFPAGALQQLRRAGVSGEVLADPFFPHRARKRALEIRSILQAVRAAEAGLARAVAILKASEIGPGGYLYSRPNERLTCEHLREEADLAMFAACATPCGSIAAGGVQAADPHHRGSGPLLAHRPIVLDFFPRHRDSGYYGDVTRTVVKGKASPVVRRAFEAVREAQKWAFRLIRHGAEGSDVHRRLCKFFEAAGYPIHRGERRREGFFHGTGHGLGLELHEAPTLGMSPARLESGHVITVEPGLYYPRWGGVRIEDVVLVERGGCRKLSRFPLFLEIP